MDRIKLRRPSPSEVESALAPSAETEFVELHKPLYDFLIAQLHEDAVVSQYVNGKISAELVRLSKMRNGRGGWDHITPEMRRASAQSRWDRYHTDNPELAQPAVRVRVFEKAYEKYQALSENRTERTVRCGLLLNEDISKVSDKALVSYHQSHKRKPPKFISVPKVSVEMVKVIAREKGVPFSKIISIVLERS